MFTTHRFAANFWPITLMVMLVLMLGTSTVAVAQESSPAADTAAPSEDLPAVEPPPAEELPTEAPAPVEEIPTDVPTQDVPDPATETPPSEVPPLEEPTPASTESPADPALADSTPPIEAPTSDAGEPSLAATPPTSAPAPTDGFPSIAWSIPTPIACDVIDGETSLGYGGQATWRCDLEIHTDTSGELPADLHTDWVVDATYDDTVSFQVPSDSDDDLLPPDYLPDGVSARAKIRTPFAQQKLTLEVVAERTTCSVGERELELTFTPEFGQADGVDIVRTDEPSDPLTLTTTSKSSGEPTVRFDGPIAFAPFSATAAGLESTESRATATLVVDGSWDPCSTWFLNLQGDVDLGGTSATMRVVAINNDPPPQGACDLSVPCGIATLPNTGDAATPIFYTVQLELELDPLTPPGAFDVTVSVDLESVPAQP